jgi:GT2 family glycosyltransferase
LSIAPRRMPRGNIGLDMTGAPIALFVYNRPAHTRQTVAALRKCNLAGNSDLFVFSDAPKRSEAADAVRQVRAYVGTIDGFRTITIVERAENYGLARSIIEGVTQLTQDRGRVIVLEDDLIVAPHFLEYMNTALDRYESEDRVMQVAGHMFPVSLQIKEDALFLPFITSWGWATWGRAWQRFDRREENIDRILGDATAIKLFDLNGHYKYSKILRAQQQKKVDSWAIFWYLSVFMRKGLALFPKKALVKNLGFDGTGVNCTVSKLEQQDLDLEFRVSIWPDLIDVSVEAENVMKGIPATRVSFAAIFNRLARGLRLGR